jgi:hypothetical protein
LTLRRVTSLELIKNEKGDMVADSHRILARCRNHFSLLMNVHGVNDDRHIRREPLVPEIEMAIEKLERHHQVLIPSRVD